MITIDLVVVSCKKSNFKGNLSDFSAEDSKYSVFLYIYFSYKLI